MTPSEALFDFVEELRTKVRNYPIEDGRNIISKDIVHTLIIRTHSDMLIKLQKEDDNS